MLAVCPFSVWFVVDLFKSRTRSAEFRTAYSLGMRFLLPLVALVVGSWSQQVPTGETFTRVRIYHSELTLNQTGNSVNRTVTLLTLS